MARRQFDLVCLVADSNMHQTLRALLSRSKALAIASIEFKIVVHPEHDPGCYLRSQDFLRPFVRQADRALVLFDREGCGNDEKSRRELEEDLEARLMKSGWEEDRSAAVVIDPELEAWFWSDSPHVASALGWQEPNTLKAWLVDKGHLEKGDIKPARPKEAVEQALRMVRLPRSSSIYGQLADKVSFRRCKDPAFAKLRDRLKAWFPSPTN